MINAIQNHLAANPLKVQKVELDGWDEPLYVREMDAEAMSAFLEVSNNREEGDESFSVDNAASIIVLHLCDEDGSPSIPVAERAEGEAELKGLKFGEVTELFMASLTVSGLAQGEIEDVAGN